MKKQRTTQKSIKDKLDAELLVAEDIIGEFESPAITEVSSLEVIETDKRIVNTRRERGLAPRTQLQSNPEDGDLNNDYQYVRENLYNLIERGNDALEGILELAKEMEHPRAYEVASGLIKNVSETTMELLKIQKELKSMREGDAPKTNVNNLYVGSTAELQEMLKGKTFEEKD
jgi:hypothetical protein